MQRLTDPRPLLGLGYSSWIEARIDAATKAHQAQKNRLEGRFLRLPGNTGEAWKVPTWCPGETRTKGCILLFMEVFLLRIFLSTHKSTRYFFAPT